MIKENSFNVIYVILYNFGPTHDFCHKMEKFEFFSTYVGDENIKKNHLNDFYF